MADLFGFAGGQQQAQQDNQQKALFGLQMAEGEQHIEAEGFELKKAKLALGIQEKKIAEMQAAARKRQAGQQGGVDTSASSSESQEIEGELEDTFHANVNAGDTDGAEKAARALSELRKNDTEIEKGKGEVAHQFSTKALDILNSYFPNESALPDANDPAAQKAWQEASQATQMATGHMAGGEGKKYSPELLKQLRGMLANAQEAGAKKLQNADLEAKADSHREAILRPALIKAQTRAANSLADNRKKVGDVNSEPSPAEIKPIMDLIERDSDTETAPDIATRKNQEAGARIAAADIAMKARIYYKQNMPRTQANAKAYQEAKASGMLDSLQSKGIAGGGSYDRAMSLIDKLTAAAEKSKTSKLGVTGLAGRVARAEETLGNITGMDASHEAHDFESDLSGLQLLIPKLYTGSSRSAKDERDRVSTMARGLKLGDTAENTISALADLKETLSQGRSGSRTPAAMKVTNKDFEVGKVYVDANGNKAKYKGPGQWEPQ